MVQTTSQSSSRHFHALLFSYSLFLAYQPPLYTAALGATHKSSIGPAAGHSGGCPSSAPAQFVMRACSDFWPLLGSTSSVETQARDCSSDLSDPCSTSPLLLEYFGDKYERDDTLLPAKLSGCYANLVACGLRHPLPCSLRQLRGRWSTPSNSLSAPSPLHDLYNAISIGSYPNLRDVPPNPLPERAARGQGMTAVHPADEGLEPRSPMHLCTKTKNGSYMIWPGTGLSHAPELWTRFLVQPNSLQGFWKKNSSYLIWFIEFAERPEPYTKLYRIVCFTWDDKRLHRCEGVHWAGAGWWEKVLLCLLLNEKVGTCMCREKSAWIVLGICCWRLRLLRRFFRSDQLLSIFVDSELQRTFSRATWLHLELHRSSHWN